MLELHRQEQAILIPGPSGRLEAQVMGINFAEGANREAKSDEASRPKIVGIICHPHPLYQGTMHNKVITTIVRAWQKMGLATIRFNFRGVGQSEGTYGDEVGEVEDLKAVIHWLLRQPLGTELKLWLGGFSFGALIFAKVASETLFLTELGDFTPSLLLSIAPVVSRFQLLADQTPTCPWVIIQGENDELTLASDVVTWFDKVQKNNKDQYINLITCPQATHFFHGCLVALQAEIIKATCLFLNSD